MIVGSGTTIVLFDDEPIPPTGTGFLEICKNPPGFQDPAVTGSWHFTITDQNGDPVGPVGGVDVITNQCSFPLQVPAGILTVTETARAGFQLTSVFTDADGRARELEHPQQDGRRRGADVRRSC